MSDKVLRVLDIISGAAFIAVIFVPWGIVKVCSLIYITIVAWINYKMHPHGSILMSSRAGIVAPVSSLEYAITTTAVSLFCIVLLLLFG